MSDDYTVSLPACDEHPPLRDWPWKSLIRATCPVCGRPGSREKTARELRARRLVEEREKS